MKVPKFEKDIMGALDAAKFKAAEMNYMAVMGRLQECRQICKGVIDNEIKEPATQIHDLISEAQDKIIQLIKPSEENKTKLSVKKGKK